MNHSLIFFHFRQISLCANILLMKSLFFLLFFSFAYCADAPVLYLEGTPYERGVQHGSAMKEKIHANLGGFIDNPEMKQNERVQEFLSHLPQMLPYIPQHFMEEMQGVAEGADVPFQKILIMNLFPEMFHCIGIGVQGKATHDGSLYHVRVLDYGVGKDLQHSAVLMVVKPEGKHAYMTVGYAGFIGTVTGMNEKKIAIGEIGGDGYGYWDGLPMSFLLREILETCATLEEAKELLARAPRTCEYYYVISDGNEEKMVGVYATASQLHFIEPGQNYALLAPPNLPKNYGDSGENDKFFLNGFDHYLTDCQLRVHDASGQLAALFNYQPQNCIVLRGFGYPERYPIVVNRILDSYGFIDHLTLQNMIRPPATNETNLHNAIFHPSTLEAWVSHAGLDGSPASLQPYTYIDFKSLIE